MVPFLLFLLLGTAFTAPVDHPDRVTNLPGAPVEPSFPLYSGFINAEDNGTEHKLFYVLAEAINADPETAPLLVWLNGGPGSSSLLGLFLIHGPYLLNTESDTLRYNDFSWNQYANVLYLETPSGVGFSHPSKRTNLVYNDNSTARINRKALNDFMTRVHPRYANRDFYITGELYAGVYNPFFAREILTSANTLEFANKNLKGIVMGNAHVDDFSDYAAFGIQLYSLGLIPEKYREEVFDAWERIVGGNHTAISYDSELGNILGTARYSFGRGAVYNVPLQCNLPADEKTWHIAKPVPVAECNSEVIIEIYLNREDVQHHLHVREVVQPNVHWQLSNDAIFWTYSRTSDTIPIYKDIFAAAQSDFRILFYTGDMDLVCPPLQVAFGARRISEDNEMTVVNSTNWSYLGDFGGARTSYATNDSRVIMDVITVRGASHMVPLTHPDRAFQMINNFIFAESQTPIDYSQLIARRTK